MKRTGLVMIAALLLVGLINAGLYYGAVAVQHLPSINLDTVQRDGRNYLASTLFAVAAGACLWRAPFWKRQR